MIRVAVAANFRPTFAKLLSLYKNQHLSPIEFQFSSASSGMLYQQIFRGAPFDIFFSANKKYPQSLYKLGYAQQPITYAYGRLLLVAKPSLVAESNHNQLEPKKITLAIANPNTAPYGKAARQALEHFPRGSHYQLVHGRSISHVLQLVQSGHAHLGLISQSLLRNHSQSYPIPAKWHQPIEQNVSIIHQTRSKQKQQAVVAFVDFIFSKASKEIIDQDGYTKGPYL